MIEDIVKTVERQNNEMYYLGKLHEAKEIRFLITSLTTNNRIDRYKLERFLDARIKKYSARDKEGE